MPNYDLRCASCRHEFKARASIAERTEQRIVCPACGANDLEAVFKSVNYSIKKENPPVCPNRSACGSSCPHAG